MRTVDLGVQLLLFLDIVTAVNRRAGQSLNITKGWQKSPQPTTALSSDLLNVSQWESPELNGWSEDYARRFADQVRNVLESNLAALLKNQSAAKSEAEAAVRLLFYRGCACGQRENDDDPFVYSSSKTCTDYPRPLQTASCCDSVLEEWSRKSSRFNELQTRHFYTSSQSSTILRKLTFIDGKCDGPFTKLSCETVSRALCTPTLTPITITRYAPTYISATTTTGPVLPYPIPRPACSIASSDCTSLWDIFYRSEDSFRGGIYSTTSFHGSVTGDPPFCEAETMWSRRDCYFGEQMQLLLWPMEIEESYICPGASQATAWLSAQAMPTSSLSGRTVVWDNNTLVSPTPYAFYSTMAHRRGIGDIHYNIAIPLRPDNIMYEYGWAPLDSDDPEGSQNSFTNLNLTDMAYIKAGNSSFPAVPAESYKYHVKCDPGWHYSRLSTTSCDGKTIFQDWQPRIEFTLHPSDLLSIDPKWSRCGFAAQGAWDPPRTLPVGSRLAVPEIPVFSSQNTPPPIQTPAGVHEFPGSELASAGAGASPGSGLTPPLPSQTSHYNVATVFATQVPKATGSGGIGDMDPMQTRAQAVFYSSDRTFVATQLAPGTFAFQGKTFSKGGSPITDGPLTISALESGVVVEGVEGISSDTLSRGGASGSISGASKSVSGASKSISGALKSISGASKSISGAAENITGTSESISDDYHDGSGPSSVANPFHTKKNGVALANNPLWGWRAYSYLLLLVLHVLF